MLKKRRNSLAIVYAIATLFIIVFTVSLIGYFLFEQNPFSANILVMSIGLGVFFSLIFGNVDISMVFATFCARADTEQA